jgi:hypothetical protein
MPDWAAVGIPDFDPSLPFLEAFDRYFAPRLRSRAPTFRALFAAAPAHPTIIETGCLRDPGNWDGDGQSTIMFDWLAACEDGHAWAVDASWEAVDAARRVVSPRCAVVDGDAVTFLDGFRDPIDILYLDSLDFDGNRPQLAARQTMFELTAAMSRLRPGSIVAVDDTWRSGPAEITGKGVLVYEYMERTGRRAIAEGYQFVWRM